MSLPDYVVDNLKCFREDWKDVCDNPSEDEPCGLCGEAQHSDRCPYELAEFQIWEHELEKKALVRKQQSFGEYLCNALLANRSKLN